MSVETRVASLSVLEPLEPLKPLEPLEPGCSGLERVGHRRLRIHSTATRLARKFKEDENKARLLEEAAAGGAAVHCALA